MNLKDFLPVAKEEKKEFYWSLVIEPGWVQAGIWSIEDGIAQVVSISPGAAWEVDEDLVNAADAALSAAIQNLPEEFGEPQKTVFALPNSWISKGQIKEEHLSKIKKICTDLALEPTGFVVISEAIAHLIKSEEGAPVNAVILGVGKEILEISVFKLGSLIGTSEVARSVSLADDAIEGLARFPKTDTFPSRFLIYNGKEAELEEAKQALLDANWEESKNIKFLHTPKVEIIKPDRKILATSLAGASEIGQVSKVSEVTSEPFVKETSKEVHVVEEENITSPDPDISPEDLGFVVNADISEQQIEKPVEDRTEIPEAKVPSTPLRRRIPKFNFSRLKVFSGKLPSLFGKNFFGLSVLIAVLFTIFISVWWFVPSAIVNVYISPKTLEEKVDLTIDTTKSTSDIATGILAGRVLKTEVLGEKNISTSGTKLVGEKAVGSIKVQNGLAVPVNLPAGTILAAANDLRFTTTKTASVSAALSPSSPGVANVEVVAGDIGAQYNLAKDESFKVGAFPKADVDGVSVSDLTGGSSRQITAVSEADQESLKEELNKELLTKGRVLLASEISSDETFVENALLATDISEEFSHKVGEESANLKLTLKISITSFAVNKKEIFEYSKEILKNKVPSGYTLTEDEVDIDFDVTNEEKGVYETEAIISASLLPEIDKGGITQKISGKYPRLVEAYFASIPGFTRAEIRITPSFPGFLGTLPHVAKRISVDVLPEK